MRQKNMEKETEDVTFQPNTSKFDNHSQGNRTIDNITGDLVYSDNSR